MKRATSEQTSKSHFCSFQAVVGSAADMLAGYHYLRGMFHLACGQHIQVSHVPDTVYHPGESRAHCTEAGHFLEITP